MSWWYYGEVSDLCNWESTGKGNGNQHGGKDICTVSELTSTEAKIDMNLDILRNIVEVIEEGILVKIWWKKELCWVLKILNLRRKSWDRVRAPYNLNVTKENLQLTSDTRTILMRYCFMTFQSWISLVDGECLMKGDKSRKMMEFQVTLQGPATVD